MDPLSVTASVVGITTAALQSVQTLATAIENIKGAPDTVQSTSADLQAVQLVLQDLDTALRDDPSQLISSSAIKSAVKNCNAACELFQSKLQQWTKHSTEEKTVWRDRLKIALFQQSRIKAFTDQLNGCKSTLSIALYTEKRIAMSRQDDLLKDAILEANERFIQQQNVQADDQGAEIERSQQQLTLQRSTEPGHESDQTIQELRQELERQKAINTSCKEMCDEALAKTVYARTGQNIKGVKATNYGTAVTGFYNASEQESKIRQDISDITADNWGIAVTGVARDVDFKSLRPSGSGGGGL